MELMAVLDWVRRVENWPVKRVFVYEAEERQLSDCA
jgi:hypothetical protein